MARTKFVEQLLDILDKRVPELNHLTKDGRERLVTFLHEIYHQGLYADKQTKEELKLQKLADKIYDANFGGKCPFRVYQSLAYTDHLFQAVQIFDSKSKAKTLELLCHELLHVAYPTMRHGKKFEAKVKEMVSEAKHAVS